MLSTALCSDQLVGVASGLLSTSFMSFDLLACGKLNVTIRLISMEIVVGVSICFEWCFGINVSHYSVDIVYGFLRRLLEDANAALQETRACAINFF